MNIDSNVLVVLCGIGTFLIRYLPIWKTRSNTSQSSSQGRLTRFFQGIGPAAITALVIVSLWPTFAPVFRADAATATVLALMGIVLTKRMTSGIALPTLVGAVLYGLVMHLGSTW